MDESAPHRARPRWHFTVRSGWLNDPHGIVFTDGRYHLFFQHNPASTTWAEGINWGHAVSHDLIVWDELPVALAPEPGEVGCWSGSVVLADEPTLFYTRIVPGDLEHGQVARAVGSPDLGQWRRDPAASVVEQLPPGVAEARDPVVWRVGNTWRMLLGARLTCGDGAALQYRSADLITWDYDGVLAQRSPRDTAGTWTGSMWECPQLFALDGTWVLLISILDAGVPQYVAYALGDYDGRRFAARVWGRFGHGDLIYATTAFLDADGRRCVMSWLRERGGAAPAGSPWAGALSLPWVLRVEGDLLVARPHPNLPVGAVVADGRTQRIVDFDLVEMVEDGVSGITVPDRGNAMDLQRFIAAQDGVYADALAELRAGRKRTHWMWFVFPQLAGLGSSATAQRYGIASLDEARAYLDDPVLGPRLRECAAAMLAADGTSATEILGYPDDLKLRSSMTLFARAAGDPAVFQAVLDRYYDGPDTRTLDLLADA